jgi:hypothetical protein
MTIPARAVLLLALVPLVSLARGDEPAAPLPPGVAAVWDGALAAKEATPTRERVCLNGLWRWQPGEPGATTVPADGWGHFKVPGPWPGITDYMQHDAQAAYPHPRWEDARLGSIRAAWYERTFTIPEGWAGRRVAIEAAYVNSLAVAFVDGRPAGALRFPGGELDLTPLDLEPGEHRLSLLVVALPLKGVMLSYTDSASAREVAGSVARRGLCGDVFLVMTPPGARIDDVRVETSVRRSEIALDTALLDLDPSRRYTLRARLACDGRVLADFESPAFGAGDLEDGRHRWAAAWKPDRLWDLHTPGNQETLTVTLHEADRPLDTFWDRRFGFREFGIDGRDFTLNGSRIDLQCVPLDNAQISPALASYEGARESLRRLKAIGINFVYTHNYGCEPGSHLAFDEILRAADDEGVLVSFSQPHFSHYDWKAEGADASNGYRRHAAFYTRAAGNHPSVVLYGMSHNATGYAEDMNPDRFGTEPEAPRERWALNNVRLARRAEAIVNDLDPSRIVYHHASGNLGPMHDSNFYPNFVPIQEMSDWFATWAKSGVKPAFTCEYGAPFTWDWTLYRGWYKGERSFGSARVPWDFSLAEWNAQFLGDRAYAISNYERRNIRWEAKQFREGKLWHRWDYPHEVGSPLFDDRHEVIGRYLTDNLRAFRTLGVSATSPWEHGHFWRLKPDADRSRKDYPVDWARLQRPGYSPDFLDATYERLDLSRRLDDWEATADGRAILRNYRPRLGYLAGPPEAFTGKAHNALPGETLARQAIVINNSRVPTACAVSWSLDLPRALGGAARLDIPTGDQRRVALALPLPRTLPPGRYTLLARFDFGDGEVQEDTLPIDVLPASDTGPVTTARVALFDPKGETAALLRGLGVAAEVVAADANLDGYDLLILGKGALTPDGPAPRLDRVRDGLRVLVFEQSAAALEKRLGFRVVEYGLRQVFPRVPDHPALSGLSADHLRDWRGEATLTPPRLDYDLDPTHGPTVTWCDIRVSRAWRCGNRGNVASVLIEKPARGDFLPIVDGGFSLQYSPLMEYREGSGRVVFCQLDVTGRTEADPAASRLARQLVAWAAAPVPPRPTRPVLYAGEPAGLAHLAAAGVAATVYEGGRPEPRALLVLGPGAGPKAEPHREALAAWRDGGGTILAVGCEGEALGDLITGFRTRSAEHIAATFDPPPAASPLAGVAPADVHVRDPREVPLVVAGAPALGDGVLAATPDGRAVACALAPWWFSDLSKPNVKRTYRRTSALLSRLLGNLDAAAETPLLGRFAEPVAAGAAPRWQSGLYLDSPEEWDDPNRFFRW